MATGDALNSITVITAPIDTATGGNAANLSDRESILSYEPMTGTPSLFGGDLLMTADSEASTVPCSATKARYGRASLSDKLTPLLISSGLVRGITPLWMRERSDLQTPVFAFEQLDGNRAA